MATVEFFSKSHVLKREYEDEYRPFGWMQAGVFVLFAQGAGCIAGELTVTRGSEQRSTVTPV